MSPRRAAASRAPEKVVTFRGPPNRVASLIPLPQEAGALRQRTARLEGAEVRALRIRPLTHEGAGIGRLTIRLPRSTPPGTYSGSVEIGGRELPIVAEVEPRPRLEATPRGSVSRRSRVRCSGSKWRS
jgi:hypothetical protein